MSHRYFVRGLETETILHFLNSYAAIANGLHTTSMIAHQGWFDEAAQAVVEGLGGPVVQVLLPTFGVRWYELRNLQNSHKWMSFSNL